MNKLLKIQLKKTITFLYCIFFLISGFCYAFSNDKINISIKPEYGLMYGSISEYVFENGCKNTDNLESRLDWDLTNIQYFSGTINATILEKLYLNFSGKIAVPARSGYLQDYDWLNSFYWVYDDPKELTNYSINNNFLENYYDLSIGAGFNIPVSNVISITPIISYEYYYLKFRASDGYKKYKSNRFMEIPMYGDCITYEQEANILKLGTIFSTDIVPNFNFTWNFFCSPCLASVTAIDRHLNAFSDYPNGKAFKDSMENAWFFSTGSSASYCFNKFHKLGLNINFEYLPLVKGPNSMKPLNKNKQPDPTIKWNDETAKGGTSHFIFNISVVYSFSF